MTEHSEASRRGVSPVPPMQRPRPPTMKATARGGEAAGHGPGAIMPSAIEWRPASNGKRTRRGRPPEADSDRKSLLSLGVERTALKRARRAGGVRPGDDCRR